MSLVRLLGLSSSLIEVKIVCEYLTVKYLSVSYDSIICALSWCSPGEKADSHIPGASLSVTFQCDVLLLEPVQRVLSSRIVHAQMIAQALHRRPREARARASAELGRVDSLPTAVVRTESSSARLCIDL